MKLMENIYGDLKDIFLKNYSKLEQYFDEFFYCSEISWTPLHLIAFWFLPEGFEYGEGDIVSNDNIFNILVELGGEIDLADELNQ